MLSSDYTRKLLGLEDVIVTDFEETPQSIDINIEMPRRIHICPRCGQSTDRIHDYRLQIVRDAPIRTKPVYLYLRKRRYRCPDCGKRFYENVPFVPKYYQVTSQLIAFVIDSFREMRTMKSIGMQYNISGMSVARYFDNISIGRPNLPNCIGIDEYKGNAGGEKFQCILTDPKHRKILDLLPSRKAEDLSHYFTGFKDWRNVDYVVMDMSNLFRSVAKARFPNAEIVADKYHVMRLVDWAFESVRKEEQNKFSKKYRRTFKRSKSILRKKWINLKDDEKDKLVQMLNISKPLAKAYYLREDFRNIFECQDRASASKALGDWIFKAEFENLDSFKSCIHSITEWQHEILNIFEFKLTNAYTEGCNNKTKVLKRISYGVRDFERFRKRRMFMEF